MAPPPSSETKPVVSSDFPTTQWTLLAQATLHGDEKAAAALNDFCLRYRSPVIGVLRRRGLRDSRLEDVTHDFFIQLMQSSALKRADPQRGRFRQFFCGSLNRFLADDADHGRALKRGGGVAHVHLDDAVEAEMAGDPGHDEAAIQWLDREWALGIFSLALQRLQQEWTAPGRLERLAVLRAFLPGATEILSQEEAAARLGLTMVAFRSELHRFRDAFRRHLRAEVAQTVSSPSEIDDEMRHLRESLSRAGD